MLNIEAIPVIEQARRLKNLMALQGVPLPLDDSFIRAVPVLNERLLVTPKLSLWSRAPIEPERRDWSEYNRALAWLDHFRQDGAFRLEDHLAEAAHGIDHGPRFHHLRPETAAAHAALECAHPGDFIVWRLDLDPDALCVGLAPDDALDRILGMGRIPLDPIALLCLLHTHPGVREQMPWLDALGAEVGYKGEGRFDHVPFLDCRISCVNADWNWKKLARPFRIALCAYAP
ncbi:MAG: hypothetical protein NUW08_03450 [Candidatus Uhrbacteria bacterium]|nr:hypothetical protein [Candidatus Uhrbacteria bacterium]